MKQCPYCRAEYPDSATLCIIDHTPLDKDGVTAENTPTDDPPRQQFSFKPADFGVVSEQKIPLSLSIVSYLFFLPGAIVLAVVIFILLIFFAIPLSLEGNLVLSLSLTGLLALLLIWLFLAFPKTVLIPAAGICVLMLYAYPNHTDDKEPAWQYMAGFGLAIATIFLSRGLRQGSRGWRTFALISIWWAIISTTGGIVWYFFSHDPKKSLGFSPMEIYLYSALYLLFLAWQYRVLTRPDVRELFGL